jgi:hypothetical protein
MKNAETVPERKSFFAKIKTTILVDKPASVAASVATESSVIIQLG